MLDLKKQYEYMKEDVDAAINRCLDHQRWIFGPEVSELELAVSSYIGTKYCIGVSSGTEALVLSLRALAIKTKGQEYFDRKDKIITTPFTFTATGDAILRAGATPVFIDIDPTTYNIDTNIVKEYLDSHSESVVGIVPVHLYGQSCQMDEIMLLADKYNLFVVEDVAQAFGGKWKDRKLGSIGTTGCFSFFPSKNLGGFGDGGMVATDDEEIAELIRMLLRHGGKDKYNVDHIGYNARLDTLQAAIILAKLKYIDEFNEGRRKVAKIYNKELQDIEEIILPVEIPDSYHVYHQYTIQVKDGRRNDLQQYLKDNGISTMIYYPVPLHKMKVFNKRCIVYGSLKNSEKAVESVLSLPIDPFLERNSIVKIVTILKDF